MIRYTPAKQLSLEGFTTPFSQTLSSENRWVVLANCIPWDKLAQVYYRKMGAEVGAPTLSARMVIGAVIIKYMLNIDDREASIYQPHVRPMPRDKDRVSTEFGSKQTVMLKDGYTHVEKLSWDNYNEGTGLIASLESYRRLFGCYPERVLADKLFGNRENRRFIKENGIRYVGKSLGRPAWERKARNRQLPKELAERNAIEGKFGRGKTPTDWQRSRPS